MKIIVLVLLLTMPLAGCVLNSYRSADRNELLAYVHYSRISSINIGDPNNYKGGLFYVGSDLKYHYFVVLYGNAKVANKCKVSRDEIDLNDIKEFDVSEKNRVTADSIFKPEDFDKFIVAPWFKDYKSPNGKSIKEIQKKFQ